jgi:hypothetical protein
MKKFIIAEQVLGAVIKVIANAIHPNHSHSNVNLILEALKALEGIKEDAHKEGKK